MRVQKVRFFSRNVRQMYLDAFPPAERMPFPVMVAMSKLWNTDFLEFYDGDTLCGFVYLAHNRKLVFIMFLAVDETLRSKGYGSTILHEIQSRYSDKKIIVSIEPCNAAASDLALRTRRKAFYNRNGYQDTGYRMRLSGVEQEILICNGNFDKREFRLFFVLYSNGTVWPKIWRRETENHNKWQMKNK
ncbi:MAG: GNAT family N-acetyltransferase [bacterium]|nr:GNAT family N-acetyltransferase [bacterium]